MFASHLRGMYAADSCVMIRGMCVPYQVLECYYGGESLKGLKKIFFTLAPDEAFDWDDATYYRDLYGGKYHSREEELNDLVLDKMKEIGVKKTAQAIFSYITAEDYRPDLDAEIQFVQGIE